MSNKCIYCGKPAKKKKPKHDIYGEFVLGIPLIVCNECDEDLQHEDGPWSEIH